MAVITAEQRSDKTFRPLAKMQTPSTLLTMMHRKFT